MRTTIQRENSEKPVGFDPKSQSANVGDTMFWFNEDRDTQHQIVWNNINWGAPIEPQCPSQTLSIDATGTYEYHCAFHDDESGTLTVES